MPSSQSLLAELVALKEAIILFDSRKKLIEAQLVADLTARGKKTVSTDYDGETLKGTLVAPERVTTDEAKLKKALSAATWDKVTSKVLDKDKLEAAVAMGIVDPNVVAAASEVKPTKPYIKVSGKVPAKDIKAVARDGGVTITTVNGNLKPAARRVVRAKTKGFDRPASQPNDDCSGG